MKVCATCKGSNVKSFYDHGDLEYKFKVKLMIWTKRSSYYASLVINIKNVPQVVTHLWTFIYPIGYKGKI